MRYLMLQLAGEVPSELDRSIHELDADGILAREVQRLSPATRRPQRIGASGASLSDRPVP